MVEDLGCTQGDVITSLFQISLHFTILRYHPTPHNTYSRGRGRFPDRLFCPFLCLEVMEQGHGLVLHTNSFDAHRRTRGTILTTPLEQLPKNREFWGETSAPMSRFRGHPLMMNADEG